MGFRSVLATGHTRFKISNEFRERYPWLNFPEKAEDGYYYGPITGKREAKFYNNLAKTDVFLALKEQLEPDGEYDKPYIIVVLLHECGGITRVRIDNNGITGKEPTDWKDVESVEHNYCYGCSELNLR